VIEPDQLSADLLPQEPTISSITMAELAAGPHATDDTFDAAAARVYGRVYAATRSLGRKPRDARTIDLLIASVALANNLPLFTRNPDDFAHLRGVGLEVYAI
jgi:predicted nucleic acid-binding protein